MNAHQTQLQQNKTSTENAFLSFRIDTLSQRIHSLDNDLKLKFKMIDKRFDAIDKRFDAFEKKFDDRVNNLAVIMGESFSKLYKLIEEKL